MQFICKCNLNKSYKHFYWAEIKWQSIKDSCLYLHCFLLYHISSVKCRHSQKSEWICLYLDFFSFCLLFPKKQWIFKLSQVPSWLKILTFTELKDPLQTWFKMHKNPLALNSKYCFFARKFYKLLINSKSTSTPSLTQNLWICKCCWFQKFNSWIQDVSFTEKSNLSLCSLESLSFHTTLVYVAHWTIFGFKN